MDKMNNESWKDSLRELDNDMRRLAADIDDTQEDAQLVRSFYKEILKVVRQIVGEREITLQEAALDAESLPLISYSCEARYIQVKPPKETVLLAMRAKDRAKKPRTEGPNTIWSYCYAPPVVKYIKRPVGNVELDDGTTIDMDRVCMYEFFSEFNLGEFDADKDCYRVKKRKKPCIVIPTPIMKPSHDDERWCYQMLMLFTPFRDHIDVLRHPQFRQLSVPIVTDYQDADFSTVEIQATVTTQPSVENGPTARVVEEEEPVSQPELPEGEDNEHGSEQEQRSEEEEEEETQNVMPVQGQPKEGLYDLSTELFREVVGQVRKGWWPEKYIAISSILEAIEGIMKDAYMDQNMIPSRDEFMRMVRQMGPEVEGAMDVDAFLTAAVAEHVQRESSSLVDDPDNGKYCNKIYGQQVALTKTERNKYFKNVDREAVPNERPRRTYQDLLDDLNQDRRAIRNCLAKYKGLKVRQKAVLLVVLNSIEDLIKVEANALSIDAIRTTRLILQGEAGTGKSYVLKSVVDLCCKYLTHRAVKVFAPTANAARVYEKCDCKSSTFHRIWKKKVSDFQGPSVNAPLGVEPLMEWLSEMKGAKALICDEMSMLSPADIDLMSSRLTDAFCGKGSNRPKTDFNSFPIVILCGDLYQLPPVKALPLYRGLLDLDEIEQQKRQKAASNREFLPKAELEKRMGSSILHNKGTELYRRFFDKAIILNENVRQEGDVEWRKLLRRVRIGDATEEDQLRLLRRVWTLDKVDPRKKECEVWRTCPRYYPRVEDVDRESAKMMRDINPNPEACFDASPQITINNRVADAIELKQYKKGLYHTAHPLKLAIDTPVMITKNSTEGRDWGVVNGSTGVVKGYVSENGINIKYVLVKLDAPLAEMPPLKLKPPNGPEIILPGVWPVSMEKHQVCVKGVERTLVVIMKFPLQLAYALTIHKAQGITVENAVVDITHGFAGQMPYVALSRITKEEGLMLARPPALSDINKFATSSEKPLLEAELERISDLQGALLQELGLLQEDEEVVQRLNLE